MYRRNIRNVGPGKWTTVLPHPYSTPRNLTTLGESKHVDNAIAVKRITVGQYSREIDKNSLESMLTLSNEPGCSRRVERCTDGLLSVPRWLMNL